MLYAYDIYLRCRSDVVFIAFSRLIYAVISEGQIIHEPIGKNRLVSIYFIEITL